MWPGRGRLPKSTVIGGATETVRRLGGGVGAARRHGTRGGRGCRFALASGRPDTGRARRGLAELTPMSPPSRTTRRRCTTLATSRSWMPITGWTTCATPSGSPQRCRQRWRTAPGLRGAVPTPAADPRRRDRRPEAWTFRLPRWPRCAVTRKCLGLRDFVVDLHSAGAAVDFSVCIRRDGSGRAAADVGPPSADVDAR